MLKDLYSQLNAISFVLFTGVIIMRVIKNNITVYYNLNYFPLQSTLFPSHYLHIVPHSHSSWTLPIANNCRVIWIVAPVFLSFIYVQLCPHILFSDQAFFYSFPPLSRMLIQISLHDMALHGIYFDIHITYRHMTYTDLLCACIMWRN